jgi:aspartyl-tRNA(Asn)/glutamyl-tRNA(Gln) amidotransferase subunit C
MKLGKDQIKKVAKLANLTISEEDEEKYSAQLSKILDYIDQLNKVDTSKVKPTYNVSGKETIAAPDIVQPSLTQDQALQNSRNTKNGFFVTKGVFSEEG